MEILSPNYFLLNSIRIPGTPFQDETATNAKEGRPFGPPSLFLLRYYNRVFKEQAYKTPAVFSFAELASSVLSCEINTPVTLISVYCGFSKLLFNAKQLVVLGDPVGTAQ